MSAITHTSRRPKKQKEGVRLVSMKLAPVPLWTCYYETQALRGNQWWRRLGHVSRICNGPVYKMNLYHQAVTLELADIKCIIWG